MLEEKSETVGRYVLHAAIARGGMATVHAARLTGAEGFQRLVAAKRLLPEYVEDPDFTAMFHDEARIASRIHHPNVVPVLDVVVTESEVMLVQEYVHGVPLSVLMRRARQAMKPVPTPIAVAIALGVLAGLHAAHEAKDELGTPLDVIHRDVSPQNVMLSVEGVPRLLDFGIAKARSCAHQTRAGVVKGKLSYLSPEQIKLDPITRRVDIYAAGVVLWELLSNRRISEGMGEGDFLAQLFADEIPTLVEECSAWRRSMGQAGWKRLIEIDAVVVRAMSLRPNDRFATALEMADALVAAHPPASQNDVAAWVEQTGGDHVEKLQRTLAASEERWRSQSRMEVATLSRRNLAVATAIEIDEDERQTMPMPRVLDDVDVDPSNEPSDPPGSLAAVERAAVWTQPRRPRYVAWLGMAAVIAAIGAVTTHRPAAITASAPPPAESAVPPTPVVAPPTTPPEITNEPLTACPPPAVVSAPVVSLPKVVRPAPPPPTFARPAPAVKRPRNL